LNPRVVVALSTVVVVLVAAAFLVNMQQGATSSTDSRSSTTVGTGGSYVNAAHNLQLRLVVNASSAESPAGGVTISVTASEYNTLAAANNVSMDSQWKLDGLSLGACGTEVYPFGVALYRGAYAAENVSGAQPIQIYPAVPCPLMIRYVTGYLFQPTSDLAVVLPGSPDATAVPMSANVTATTEYDFGAASSASSTLLGPGTYTAAAGDEWGSVVLVHFTIGSGGSTSTATGTGSTGTLEANFSIGPTQPVCSANSTTGPAPAQYSSIGAVITSQASGQALTLPIFWISSGCAVSGHLEQPLAPGAYSLNLSSCQFMGCGSALPKSFMVVAGQSTSIALSIDTGIR
jgi:hypothetical protein